MVKRWLKRVLIAAVTLLSVFVLIAAFSQTQIFRDWLRSFTLSRLDTLLVADVHLGEITGDLVSGFSIDSVSIKLADEYIVAAERLDIKYDLFQIASRKISVSSLRLVRPTINLLCGADSIWNFERMIRPSPDDSESSPFDWPIMLARLEIINGTIRLVDTAALREPDHADTGPYFVEYHDVYVHDVHLLLTSVNFSSTEKRAKIQSLRFISDAPEVTLKEMSGDFRVSNREAMVKGLTIKTAASQLILDASMKNVDLFSGFELIDLERKPVEITMRAPKLDLDELKRFIHEIDFLSGPVDAELFADGEFGRLNLHQLDLKTRSSEMHFAGTVSNLHVPEELLLNIKCRASKIDYADVMALLPGLDLPDYSSMGMGTLEFDFDGMPLDFRTTFKMRNNAGYAETEGAQLQIGGPQTLRYSGLFTVRDFDLSHLAQDSSVASRLTGRISITGSGTTLDNLNATVEATLDSSEFLGAPVGASQIRFVSSGRRLAGTLRLAVGSMRSNLVGELDRRDIALPRFKLEGRVEGLNLEDFLHDEAQRSDLNLYLKTEGTGLAWERLSCNAVFDFSSSTYKEYRIDSGLVSLEIDQTDRSNSRLSISSSLADFDITGQFDLDYIGGLLQYEIASISHAIGQRFRSLDSSLATSIDEKKLRAAGKQLSAQRKSINAEYALQFKDLEPLSILTGNRTFNALGSITGSLKGDYHNLEGSANLQLDEFFYGNADSGMLIQDGFLNVRFTDLMPESPLAELQLRVKADAGKMHINRTRLDTLNGGIFYDKEYAGFTIQADYDQDYHLRTNGQVGVSDDGIEFRFSRLKLAHKDYAWDADDYAVIAVSQSGLKVQGLVLRRDSQVVAINGSVFEGGEMSARLNASNMNLTGLRYLLSDEETRNGRRGFEGMANIDVTAEGSVASPVYTASLRARRVFFRGFPFGNIDGDLHYKDEDLHARLLIDNRAQSGAENPDLVVEGVLPVNLALSGGRDLWPDRSMNFSIQSDGLQMSLLDPLVPTFNELSGKLRTQLTVAGSLKQPQYSGTISIENCAFRFVPNNMLYERMYAQLVAEGERIRVIEARVRNIDQDNKPGRAGELVITGDFLFRDFVPSDFNFTINGQLVTVNRNTRLSDLSVYGDLFNEIPSPGLRYTGSVQNSLLKGRVIVRNSSFVLPPTTGSESTESLFSIPISVVDDTTKVEKQATQRIVQRYFALAEGGRTQNSGSEQQTVSFIDGLRYDLDVECIGGNNEIRMIFNAATNEELVANINGRFSITEDGKTWVGTLDVSRASYNFYGKRFAAEGTLMYTGDFLNPELNITATYENSRLNDKTSQEERVAVIYKITGTRFAPRSEVSMKIDDVDYTAYGNGPTSGDIQSDALTFVITGNFPISRGEANDIAGSLNQTVTSTVVGGATSLLTSTFSEFLRNRTGIINSIEIGYDTGGGESRSFGQRADIRLSGTAFKGYWRYGGKILEDPFSNANFSILYSFGDIFDAPVLRNFMFEYERRVVTTLYSQIETRRDINSARFFYRFSF